MARILLAEDNMTFATMARDILESRSHEVIHACDGVEALQLLAIEPPISVQRQAGETTWGPIKNAWTTDAGQPVLPEVILADCVMPRMGGLTLVAQLAGDERTKGIPVIVLTTRLDAEGPFKSLPNVAGFMLKPADADALLSLIDKTLGKA